MTSSTKWSAPSNIALVKYWGKRPVQLPGNASLSFTLNQSRTTVAASWREAESFHFKLLFEGRENANFQAKVEKWIKGLIPSYPQLAKRQLVFETSNTFPHSAGIASSASSMAAMALCLSDLLELDTANESQWLETVSSLARLGSGSASRSLFPHASTWGHDSETFATGMKQMHEVYRTFGDAILIVDSAQKAVSSSEGHALMEHHPFKEFRYKNANQRVQELMQLMQKDAFSEFAELIELEALELHALMMTSTPSFILMKPKTLAIIEKVRTARKQGLEICFTLDAGPNIHLLYPARAKSGAMSFVQGLIQDNLLEAGRFIDDCVGLGPRKEA